jgi:hypothetical protein
MQLWCWRVGVKDFALRCVSENEVDDNRSSEWGSRKVKWTKEPENKKSKRSKAIREQKLSMKWQKLTQPPRENWSQEELCYENRVSGFCAVSSRLVACRHRPAVPIRSASGAGQLRTYRTVSQPSG